MVTHLSVKANQRGKGFLLATSYALLLKTAVESPISAYGRWLLKRGQATGGLNFGYLHMVIAET